MKSNEVLKLLKISRVTLWKYVKNGKTGKFLNADLNGAIGIARKVFRNAVQTLTDSGTAFVPVKINLAF